jgi:MSHA biogenesis protein MshN
MSLINQMLQELDARRSDVAGSDSYGQQIRAVPDRRRIHPAWWVALTFAVVSSGLLGWMLLRPVAPATEHGASAQLALKFDSGLSMPPASVVNPAVQPAASAAGAGTAMGNPGQNGNDAPPLAVAPPPVAVEVPQPTPPARPERAKPAAAQAEPARMPREVPALAVPELDNVVSVARARQSPTVSVELPPSSTSPKRVKELSTQQQAENEYRKALLSMQQGKMAEAISFLEQALQLDPRHAGARHALVGALLESKRTADALQSARDGLDADVAQPDLAMILARLQLDKGELRTAIETLERTLPYGAERADYHAFLAALLQREEKHKQATEHYLIALQKVPQNGVWWMGVGISLQADHRYPEAQEAFKRAKATNSLSPELLAFVDTRLNQLRR